jgi:hypothetical protein
MHAMPGHAWLESQAERFSPAIWPEREGVERSALCSDPQADAGS